MARPIAGMWEVPMPPMMRATSASSREQPLAEFIDAHAGLLGAHILHVEPEDAGEFGEVVDVAARRDHRQYVAAAHSLALLEVESVFPAIRILVLAERLTIGRLIERETHLVQRVAAARGAAVENGGAPDLATVCQGLECGCFPSLGHAPSMAPRAAANMRRATYRISRIAGISAANRRGQIAGSCPCGRLECQRRLALRLLLRRHALHTGHFA